MVSPRIFFLGKNIIHISHIFKTNFAQENFFDKIIFLARQRRRSFFLKRVFFLS